MLCSFETERYTSPCLSPVILNIKNLAVVMGKFSGLIIIGLFGLLAVSLAMANDLVAFDAGSDYQVSLPNDWVEIPREVLDQYQRAVSELSGTKKTYDYGYQLGPIKKWLEYPYILVTIARTGKIAESEFKNYKRIESGFKKGIGELEQSHSQIFSSTSHGETVYDPGIRTLWTVLSTNVQNVGKVRILVAVKLTEYGYIHVVCSSKDHEFTKYEGLYRRMVHSIRLGEKDIYVP